MTQHSVILAAQLPPPQAGQLGSGEPDWRRKPPEEAGTRAYINGEWQALPRAVILATSVIPADGWDD